MSYVDFMLELWEARPALSVRRRPAGWDEWSRGAFEDLLAGRRPAPPPSVPHEPGILLTVLRRWPESA